MASFCNQCSTTLGFSKPDINVYSFFDGLKNGESIQFRLCERCGICGVGKDTNGDKFTLIVTDIGVGEALWIPLGEWEFFDKMKD